MKGDAAGEIIIKVNVPYKLLEAPQVPNHLVITLRALHFYFYSLCFILRGPVAFGRPPIIAQDVICDNPSPQAHCNNIRKPCGQTC
jgi:hypothetical protein